MALEKIYRNDPDYIKWAKLGRNQIKLAGKGGSASFNGTGAQTVFNIPHTLGVVPTEYSVDPGSAGANALFFVSADATNLIVTFAAAPASGTNNVVLRWQAKAI